MKRSFNLAALALTTLTLTACEFRNGEEYKDPFVAAFDKLIAADSFALTLNYLEPGASNITIDEAALRQHCDDNQLGYDDQKGLATSIGTQSSIEILTYIKDKEMSRKQEYYSTSTANGVVSYSGVHKYSDGKYYTYTAQSDGKAVKGVEASSDKCDFESVTNAFKEEKFIQSTDGYICDQSYIYDFEQIFLNHFEMGKTKIEIDKMPKASQSSNSISNPSIKRAETPVENTLVDSAKVKLSGRNLDSITFTVHDYDPDFFTKYTRDIICSFKNVETHDRGKVTKWGKDNMLKVEKLEGLTFEDTTPAPQPTEDTKLKDAIAALKSAASYTVTNTLENTNSSDATKNNTDTIIVKYDSATGTSSITDKSGAISGVHKYSDGKFYDYTVDAQNAVTKGSEQTNEASKRCDFTALDDTKFKKDNDAYSCEGQSALDIVNGLTLGNNTLSANQTMTMTVNFNDDNSLKNVVAIIKDSTDPNTTATLTSSFSDVGKTTISYSFE